ncbi:MAG TPA: hypothetical protein VER96_26350 [Polyangiaceae bacterium]|nr:hypothetical protein [Polyangiaceae bacterium]
MPLTCAAVPCSQVPECDFDLDCNGGKCTAGKCVAVPPQANGASCSSSVQCLSTFCQGSTCRAATGEACTLDDDCQVSHRCCLGQTGTTGLCSGEDGKCRARLGARCTKDEDCISGTCNEDAWCTQNCATNAECGVSPWGDANACETNALGQKICFPGCSYDSQCQNNLGTRYYCDPAFDSAAKICAYN